jgi:H/ACA ribonucleoprotein complex subunit 4
MDKFDNKVIIVDKPPGLTSHEVTTLIKKLFKVKRAGHAGTLDPEVSGVLPIALGRSTKLIQYIASKDKTYIALARFKKEMTREEVEKIFAKHIGVITQTPPKISAVKKVARERKIEKLQIIEKKGRLVLFEAQVQAGTYIRTLCEDIGKETDGGRMEELRRIKVGKITEDKANRMSKILFAINEEEIGNSKPILEILNDPQDLIDLPKILIKKSAIESIRNGAQIMIPALERIYGSPKKGDNVKIYCEKEFIGIGKMEISEEELNKNKKGIAVKVERMHYLQTSL